jgi:hypothetical protein
VGFGVPASDDERVAEGIGFTADEREAFLGAAGSLLRRIMTNPPVTFDTELLNSPLCWHSEACTFGTAAAVARAFDLFALVDAPDRLPRLVAAASLREALRVHAEGVDQVLGKPKRWCLGMQAFGPSGWIGMGGIGGTLAAVHPQSETTVVFLPNAMGDWRHALTLLNEVARTQGTDPL